MKSIIVTISCLSMALWGVDRSTFVAATEWRGDAAEELQSTQDSGDESVEISDAELEFFEENVRPILVDQCYECHSSESDINGGLSLDSREEWMEGGDSGQVIIPGDVEASRLIEAVRYSNRDLQMPPQNQLSPQDIEVFEQWVAMGAPDPRSRSASTTNSPSGMSLEEGRAFWSIRSVDASAPPEVERDEWSIDPIDRFILAELHSNGLAPAPNADRLTLIRRLSFDLLGVPPTPAEVERFLADTHPLAWDRLVERMLASPQYGERWGRHWLDVARYADSNGLDENLAFGQAWRYRDYVIDAFNRDKPIDRFIIEQLAGDLVPNANQESITGTGFLVLGAKVLAEPDREKLMMDTIDEQIDVTGKVFMGLTLGCARCHDHKFDPIKQSDYFGLAAIFRSTTSFAETQTGVIKHWYEHSIAESEELEKIAEIDEEIKQHNTFASSFKNEQLNAIRASVIANAAQYLVAAAQVMPEDPLTRFESIASKYDLHPRVLHHCRLHLEYHRDERLFERWHEAFNANDLESIEAYYGRLFEQASADEDEQSDSGQDSLDNELVGIAKNALNDRTGLFAVPAQPEFAFDRPTYEEYLRRLEVARLFESHSPDAPALMGVMDGEVVESIPIHIRGSHRNLGEPISRSFPAVLCDSEPSSTFSSDESGRLQLAEWIAREDHPLTSRVFVNRIWRWHFGEGLVSTTENFGVLGSLPSHPELLDWLAQDFVDSGWSTKQLHRRILLSATYQMSSQREEADWQAGSAIDPENRLLWRFPVRRLEAEPIRDSILAVAGLLDRTMGGKTVPLRNRQFVFNHTSQDNTKYDSHRRAIYLPVIRNHLYGWFQQFDFPDPTMPTGSRKTTTVAPQALLLMNSPLVMNASEHFAERLMRDAGSTETRIELAYQLAFGRSPLDRERSRALEFLHMNQIESLGHSNDSLSDVVENSGDGGVNLQSWALFCQCLFASDEFIYVR